MKMSMFFCAHELDNNNNDNNNNKDNNIYISSEAQNSD